MPEYLWKNPKIINSLFDISVTFSSDSYWTIWNPKNGSFFLNSKKLHITYVQTNLSLHVHTKYLNNGRLVRWPSAYMIFLFVHTLFISAALVFSCKKFKICLLITKRKRGPRKLARQFVYFVVYEIFPAAKFKRAKPKSSVRNRKSLIPLI